MLLINGQASDCVDPMDRGLHYGDGLFETIAVMEGQPRFWSRHLERLAEGCRRLHIPSPDPTTLFAEARRLCTGRQRGVLKMIITRGSGGQGYATSRPIQPRRMLLMRPWPERPDSFVQKGVQVRYCDTPLGDNPRLAGLKHLNRLEQVLARQEWDDPQISEGLMSNARGEVVEGTFTNLFVVEGDQLLTPPLEAQGVAGIMRGVIMEQCLELGIPLSIRTINRSQLEHAHALLLSNALIGIWPVRQLEGHHYTLPHPLVSRLQAGVAQAMARGLAHA